MSSSRLIILNLPSTTTPPSLTAHLTAPSSLSSCIITDIKVVPKRRFAFVGYKNEEMAGKVKDWFEGSFWGAGKIKVDFVVDENLNPNPAKRPRLSSPNETTSETQPKPAKQSKRLQEFMDVMQGSDANAIPIEANKPPRDDKIHTKKVEEVISEEIEPDNEEIDDAEWLRRRKATTDVSNGDTGSSTQPSTKTSLSPEESLILQTSRLFIRNLSFLTTTSDLTTFLSPYGEVSEIHLPLSKTTKEPLGTAFVQFKNAQDAVTAWKGVDGRTWMGRLIHVLPGRSKGGEGGVVGVIEGGDVVDGKNVVGKVLGKEEKNVKAEVMKKRKEEDGKGLNWATLYMNSDAVASSIADRMGIRKSDILNPDSVASDDVDGRFSTVGSAVKLALAEANVIAETKKYFETHGVNLTAFDEVKDVAGRVVRTARSKTGLLVKNIPYGTSEEVLRALFEPHGTIRTLLLPPAGTLAIIDFEEEGDAASAFKSVSYRRLGNAVVYLEKAPDGLFDGTISAEEETKKISPADQLAEEAKKRVEGAPEGEDEVEAGSTLFLKNLSFATTSERLHAVFSSLPSFAFARVSTKPDPKNATGPRLSMGFGFIGFKTREAAKKAMSGLKGFKLDGHELEVKFAQREADVDGGKAKGGASDAKKKKTTKMIVKNVPFEASKKDIKDLFSAFGTLRSCRIPKKHNSTGRGFAFLDFTTRNEAELAMEALKHTHLLGRHLVLEWAQDDEDVAAEVDRLRQKTKEQVKALEGGDERMGKRKKLGVRDGDKRGGDEDVE